MWLKLIAGLLLAAAVAYTIHLYNEGLRKQGRAEVQADWDAEKAARAEAQRLAEVARQAEVERAKQILAAREAANFAARGLEEARRAALEAEASAYLTELRSRPSVGAFDALARELWNRTLRGGGGSPAPEARPADVPAAAADARVTCEDVYEVGLANTLAGDFNERELIREQIQRAELWSWITKEKYPYKEKAPWLIPHLESFVGPGTR